MFTLETPPPSWLLSTEGRTERGSLARFTNPKNRGSRCTGIKNSFSRITKIRKQDTLFNVFTLETVFEGSKIANG